MIVVARIMWIGQQAIGTRIAIRGSGEGVARKGDIIADDEVEPVVRAAHDLVLAVAVAAAVVERLEQGTVVAGGVAEATELRAVGGGDVDRVVRAEHAAAVPQRVIEPLEARLVALVRA